MKIKENTAVRLVKKLQIKNPQGLHTRPATYIVKMLQNVKSEITFSYKKLTVNPKSILNLLTLAATKNSTLTVTVEGEDAEEVMSKLSDAFETNFGE